MIAVDTSVMIDLIGDDARAASAEEAVRIALSHGPVVACEVVISEVVAGLGHGSVVIDILEEAGIGFMPLELRSAVRAGEMQRRYKERLRAGKEPQPVHRAVPDFLIGAHAQAHADRLLTRDRGVYRTYFADLVILDPTQ